MDTTLRTATPDDIEAIVALMNRAFLNDPTARWVVPDEAEFLDTHDRLVRMWAGPVLGRGCVHIFDDLSGAAVWYPPGFHAEIDIEALRAMASHPDRFEQFLDVVDACAAYRPETDYWELYLLAVDPARQSAGAGARLLGHGLAAHAASGLPVYLESSNPRNLGFYRRHGFELLAEVGPKERPQRYPMLRPAGGD